MVPSGSLEPEPSSGMVVRVWVAWSGPALATGGLFSSVVDVVEVVLVEVVDGLEVDVLLDVDEAVEVDVVAPATVVVVVPVPIVATAVSLAADQAFELSRTHSVTVYVPATA